MFGRTFQKMVAIFIAGEAILHDGISIVGGTLSVLGGVSFGWVLIAWGIIEVSVKCFAAKIIYTNTCQECERRKKEETDGAED